MVDAWDNLDQFLSFYPGLTPLIDDHDRRLQVLQARASEYHAALAKHPGLLALVETLRAGEDTTDVAVIIAEYLVNRVTHLPNSS